MRAAVASRLSGCLFLILAGWLSLATAAAGGVGLDVRPVVGPWLLVSLLVALLLLMARPLIPALSVGALLGVASVVQWGRFIFSDTDPLISALSTALAGAAALAAASGLRLQGWSASSRTH